ncbi:acyl-ACP--UDP-N-acetylglucosamine O-acyltransferase [Desulfosarcina sp. OttesenSCG-928-A07]|nr:acyl-ACP--UDP-N-acetylglucosamine O-acyltransferase [Desulfosarcina sp. OttesenSCG-928-A07]
MIHQTAIISPDAVIGKNVTIEAYAIIKDHVTIGDNVWIGPHAVIDSFVTLGDGCRIFQFAAIGAVPQDLKFGGEESCVKIGNNVTIREFATIHRGTQLGGGITQVGDQCLVMAYAHIAHDCHVGKQVVLANNATLAGHITIGDYAIIGGLVAIHQFVKIGDYAFIGGTSAVSKDVPPYVIAAGDRAVLHGLNRVGLKRHGFSEQALSALKKTYRILFRYGLTTTEAISRIRAEVELCPEVENFISFIQSSTRGVIR